MAIGNLTTLPPFYGLYVSFFPPLIYWLFGTCHQISIGTDSITALMVAASIEKFESTFAPPDKTDLNSSKVPVKNSYLAPTRDQAMALFTAAQMFWVGVIQLSMFLFRLGFLSVYLPDPLVSAFTSGAAFHIVVAQLKTALGLNMKERGGLFKIPNVRK